jgi:hypothetical protein
MIALYTTQGGGICRFDGTRYYWAAPPKDRCFADMQVGDTIPEEWGVVSINSAGAEEAEANR